MVLEQTLLKVMEEKDGLEKLLKSGYDINKNDALIVRLAINSGNVLDLKTIFDFNGLPKFLENLPLTQITVEDLKNPAFTVLYYNRYAHNKHEFTCLLEEGIIPIYERNENGTLLRNQLSKINLISIIEALDYRKLFEFEEIKKHISYFKDVFTLNYSKEYLDFYYFYSSKERKNMAIDLFLNNDFLNHINDKEAIDFLATLIDQYHTYLDKNKKWFTNFSIKNKNLFIEKKDLIIKKAIDSDIEGCSLENFLIIMDFKKGSDFSEYITYCKDNIKLINVFEQFSAYGYYDDIPF